MTTFTIICSGPGPHKPADGVCGEADQPVTGMRCGSAACSPPPDPVAQVVGAQDDRLDQALVNLRAYRDNGSPTTAQTVAAMKLLCRVAIVLVRQRRGLIDGTD